MKASLGGFTNINVYISLGQLIKIFYVLNGTLGP